MVVSFIFQIIPPREHLCLLLVVQFLPDEVNNGMQDDLKEWHKQVPKEPDFDELYVGRLGKGVGGRNEDSSQHKEGCQVCHGDRVELRFLYG